MREFERSFSNEDITYFRSAQVIAGVHFRSIFLLLCKSFLAGSCYDVLLRVNGALWEFAGADFFQMEGWVRKGLIHVEHLGMTKVSCDRSGKASKEPLEARFNLQEGHFRLKRARFRRKYLFFLFLFEPN